MCLKPGGEGGRRCLGLDGRKGERERGVLFTVSIKPARDWSQ
jgi:hypothetical protein